MDLAFFQVFLLVAGAMVTVVLNTIGLSAFYGVRIYLLFKKEKESKAEKKQRKAEKKQRKGK